MIGEHHMAEPSDTVKHYVQENYRRLYRNGTRRDMPIVQGKELACRLGYDPRIAEMVPEALWTRFFPCGHPLRWVPMDMPTGFCLLNLGAGVGLDMFFLAQGGTMHEGCLINVDISLEALSLGKTLQVSPCNGHKRKSTRIYWMQADAEQLPVRHETVDLVLMNGVFNLFETKENLLAEVHRVLKKTGILLICDLVRTGPIPPEWGSAPEGWLWCVNGSLEEGDLRRLLERAGFAQVEILSRNCEADPFWSEVVRARKMSFSQGYSSGTI